MSIVSKVAALFAQANSTPYQEERDTFLAKAEELIVKHQIDRAALAESTGQSTGSIVTRSFVFARGDSNMPVWSGLLGLVKEVTNCRVVLRSRYPRSGPREATIVGDKTDISLFELVFEHLKIQLVREMNQHCDTKAQKTDFGIGFLIRLGEIIDEQKSQTLAEAASMGNALVPVAVSDEELQNLVGPTGQKKSRARDMDPEALIAGEAAAERADLAWQTRLPE